MEAASSVPVPGAGYEKQYILFGCLSPEILPMESDAVTITKRHDRKALAMNAALAANELRCMARVINQVSYE